MALVKCECCKYDFASRVGDFSCCRRFDSSIGVSKELSYGVDIDFTARRLSNDVWVVDSINADDLKIGGYEIVEGQFIMIRFIGRSPEVDYFGRSSHDLGNIRWCFVEPDPDKFMRMNKIVYRLYKRNQEVLIERGKIQFDPIDVQYDDEGADYYCELMGGQDCLVVYLPYDKFAYYELRKDSAGYSVPVGSIVYVEGQGLVKDGEDIFTYPEDDTEHPYIVRFRK